MHGNTEKLAARCGTGTQAPAHPHSRSPWIQRKITSHALEKGGEKLPLIDGNMEKLSLMHGNREKLPLIHGKWKKLPLIHGSITLCKKCTWNYGKITPYRVRRAVHKKARLSSISVKSPDAKLNYGPGGYRTRTPDETASSLQADALPKS
jgi:hypothetical protein